MVFQNKLSFAACLIGVVAIFESNPMFGDAECGKPSDFPVVMSSGEFLAAIEYWDGSTNPINACNGEVRWRGANYDVNVVSSYPEAGCDMGWGDDSFIVKPGCSLHLWEYCDFGENPNWSDGYYLRYDGPTVVPLAPWYGSMKTRCGFDHVACTPKDEYDVTLVCDATNASDDVQCNYIKTIGTTFSGEISDSMSIDVTIEAQLSFEFWEIFSASMGVSTTTGYDWGHVSTQAMQVTETFQVNAVATAGTILTIEQVVGNCGGSQVNTEFFRISNTLRDGTTQVSYERYLPDKTG